MTTTSAPHCSTPGAEAVENAIKIARIATEKQAVVAFDHAYHGRTNLTMALTAKSMPYKSGFGPFAREIYRAPMSYPYRDGGLTVPRPPDGRIPQIEKQVGAKNLAAIIIEPIQGEGGFIVPAPGSSPRSLAWAKERRRVHRRRGPDRLRPDRRHVRLRARGHRTGSDHHRQGHRRRHATGRRHRTGRT